MKRLFIIFILLSIQISLHAKENHRLFLEKIHLHTNKSIFIAGEPLWFKAYCINLGNNLLSKQSNVAYIELINKDGIPVSKESVILKNGMGEGGFVTNKDLPTGNYSLNAYTHWSNSFSKELITVVPIYIFNNNTTSKPPLKNSQHEVIITPLKSNSWTALDSISNQDIKIEAQVEDLERILSLQFTIPQANEQSQSEFELILRSQRDSIHSKFRFSDGKWTKKIKINSLKGEIYSFHLLNKQGEKIAEHTLFLRKLWNTTPIEKARIVLGPRKNTKIELNYNDYSNFGDTLFLSASLRKKEPVKSRVDFINFLNFYKYFDHNANLFEPSVVQSLNRVCFSSSIALYRKILTDKHQVSNDKYIEKDNFILECKIISPDTKNALSDHEILMTKTGEYADLQSQYTNTQGKCYFRLPLQSGLHDIALQLINTDTIKYNFILKDKFNKSGVNLNKPIFNINNAENLKFVKEQWENYKVREIYNQIDFAPNKDTTIYRAQSNFFGKPKIKVVIDDYVRLDSLPEYFHELISHVRIKYNKKKSNIFVYNDDQLKQMPYEALFLFDGLVFSNPNEILSMNPRDIDRIEVVPYEYLYSDSHFYGITHIISKKKNCEIQQLPFNTERYYLPLFTKECKQINKPNILDGYPDFRTDILWQPKLVLSKNRNIELEFTSSDIIGDYELVIEGISNTGKPFVLSQDILVK
ncbi:hypothetical protein DF185_17825 [Marinifilum breve]|uniref:Macroglobulin domain-containing protein n=1 Tax=Marinifilum breve TaxID=2184082 RepID=A0A2V4A7D7_9BACT|nr:hypothetical protein [Marinifilum breve]PXX97827.1 hypothetical protein DF185_17825 [Marinifilum breve]